MNVEQKANKFLSHIGVGDEYGPLGHSFYHNSDLIIYSIDVGYKDAKKMIEKSTGIVAKTIHDSGEKEFSFDYHGLGNIVCFKNKKGISLIALYNL